VGPLDPLENNAEKDMIQREDGSWLVDGNTSLERLKNVLSVTEALPGDEPHNFHTLGGLAMHQLGRVPFPADTLEAMGWRFEVLDMDKNRVDKVLVSRLRTA
jgi:putative hemolysin